MSAEEFAGLGLAPGVVRGVRSFDVDKFGRLTGIHYKDVWTPGENNAQCHKDDSYVSVMNAVQMMSRSMAPYSHPQRLNTPAPSPRQTWLDRYVYGSYVESARSEPELPPEPAHDYATCTCGFYGYFDGSDDYHDRARITAVVEAYGEVVIGTRGFRAMKAQIVALRVKAGDDEIREHVARKVSKNYSDIPTFETFDAMVAAFPPDVSLEPSPQTDPNFWTRS